MAQSHSFSGWENAKMYDITVLGATGYSGQLVAKFIAKNYPDLEWCIAGRSTASLDNVAALLKKANPSCKPPVIEVLQLDPEELEVLAKKSRVLVNAIGPFHKHSTPVVAACAKVGTYYVDITTEALWVKQVVEDYDEMAKSSGAIMIPAISPTASPDIVSWLIANEIRKSFSTGTSEIIGTGQLDITAMSGGSLTTVIDVFETYGPRWFLFGDSWILSPKKPKSIPMPPWLTRLFGYRNIPKLGAVTTSFNGAMDESIVHRSSYQQPELYGDNFHYQEYLPAGGLGSAILVHMLTRLGVLLLCISLFRTLVRKMSPAPGSGPDTAESGKTEGAYFHAIGKADGNDGRRAKASLTRKGSLYEYTAILAGAGAKVLLETRIKNEADLKDLRGHGGLVTPSALGMKFVDALRGAGVEIDVELIDE